MGKHKTAKIVLSVFFLVSLLGIVPASAASANISRSYSSSTSIPNGSLVSLVPGSSSTIQEANNSNAARLVGVALQSDQSLLAVNPTIGKVQVATSGTVNVLVSTVNGNISVGQDIATSPFNGVGMKAVSGDRIVGVAITAFNPNTAGAQSEQVKDSFGHDHDITVGFVKLSIGIGTLSSSKFSIQSLQQFVEGITGHPISVVRLIVSIVVAFVAILSIVVLVYAAIYGSIVSIGRNPLAKLAVFRTLTSVIGMVIMIAGIAVVTIYFLLY